VTEAKPNFHTVTLTPEQRSTILTAIRDGNSLVGAARAVGRSRAWLQRARHYNPEFEEQVQVALGELEQRMTRNIEQAVAEGDASLIGALQRLRANRFPQLHGDDPRLRYSNQTVREEHPDDYDDARTQDEGIPPEVRDALLSAYYADRDKP
jgi:hypothetical protein